MDRGAGGGVVLNEQGQTRTQHGEGRSFDLLLALSPAPTMLPGKGGFWLTVKSPLSLLKFLTRSEFAARA